MYPILIQSVLLVHLEDKQLLPHSSAGEGLHCVPELQGQPLKCKMGSVLSQGCMWFGICKSNNEIWSSERQDLPKIENNVLNFVWIRFVVYKMLKQFNKTWM